MTEIMFCKLNKQDESPYLGAFILLVFAKKELVYSMEKASPQSSFRACL